MYIRLHNAAVWQDSPADPQPRSNPPRPPLRTLWAQHAWKSPLGRCIGIRTGDERWVHICVHDGVTRRWHPWQDVLTERQAKQWAAIGFGR